MISRYIVLCNKQVKISHVFVPFLLDLGCYGNVNPAGIQKIFVVECLGLCMFHEGQMLLWCCGAVVLWLWSILSNPPAVKHPDAWCETTTPICSQCFNIDFVISVLNVLSLSYDTHSPRWWVVCRREALPVWRWSLNATYTVAGRYLIWQGTLLVECNMFSNGRCNFWFVMSRWWLINTWLVKQHV